MQKEGGAGKNLSHGTHEEEEEGPEGPEGRPPQSDRPTDWKTSPKRHIFYWNKQPCCSRVIVKCLTLKKKKKTCRLFWKEFYFYNRKEFAWEVILICVSSTIESGGLCYVSVMPVLYTTWLLVETKIKVAFESHTEGKKKKNNDSKVKLSFGVFGFEDILLFPSQ